MIYYDNQKQIWKFMSEYRFRIVKGDFNLETFLLYI